MLLTCEGMKVSESRRSSSRKITTAGAPRPRADFSLAPLCAITRQDSRQGCRVGFVGRSVRRARHATGGERSVSFLGAEHPERNVDRHVRDPQEGRGTEDIAFREIEDRKEYQDEQGPFRAAKLPRMKHRACAP